MGRRVGLAAASVSVGHGLAPPSRHGVRWGRWAALARIALIATALGCGGGGGGGGGGTPTEPVPSVTLNASTPNGAAVALAQGAGSTSTLLVLEVRASQVTGLYGAAFDLQVPPVLDYTGFRQGALLTSGGAVVSTQVFESAPGNLVVGVSRVGGVAGVDGSGVLVVLELQAVAAGSGSFTFSNQAGFDADGGQLPLSWSTGSVTVVR